MYALVLPSDIPVLFVNQPISYIENNSNEDSPPSLS